MGYNNTQKDKHLATASDLAIKLKQERKITSTLHNHFNGLSNEVKKTYSSTGSLPSFDDHKKGVKKIINDHYVDTAAISSSLIRDNYRSLVEQDDELLQLLINSQIDDDADEHSDDAADSISTTTEDTFNSYVKDAVIAGAVVGILLSNQKIASNISQRFNSDSYSRINTISMTETGVAFSKGKMNELDTMNDIDADFDDDTSISDYKQKKTWVAILDDSTREAHAAADGQEVDVDDPFIVDGEELDMPRDDSRGASASNIIGCRCEGQISLESRE